MKRIIKICTVLAAVAVLGLGTASCKHGHGGGGGGGGPVYTPGGGGGGGDISPKFISSDATTDYTIPTTPTALEQEVLNEMNLARTDPSGYVTSRLEPLKTTSSIHTQYSTTFLTVLDECIAEMNAMSALPALQWGGRLRMSAMEWVNIQGAGTEREDHGHDKNLQARVSKYCNWTSMGENLSYGYLTAQDIVIALIVDDGVADRGHRYNILDYAPKNKTMAGTFTHAGVAIGDHGYYGTMAMCAINYAGGYSEPSLP